MEDHRRLLLYLHGLKPVLSFMLSGKHMTYTCINALIFYYRKHLTKIDVKIFMNLYNKLIHILVLIADLYLFRSSVGVTELILIRRYP